jgi:hypothetical protein
MFDFFKKKKRPPVTGPDFSQVDSQEKAVALFRQGQLEKLFLMPLEFGGEDNNLNVLYVPIGMADVKHGIDCNVIGPLVESGTVSQYKCEPEYQGKSFIPIAVKITAWDPGEFTATVNIWGDALARE